MYIRGNKEPLRRVAVLFWCVCFYVSVSPASPRPLETEKGEVELGGGKFLGGVCFEKIEEGTN